MWFYEQNISLSGNSRYQHKLKESKNFDEDVGEPRKGVRKMHLRSRTNQRPVTQAETDRLHLKF